jgi:hypothetical protein
MIVRSGDRDVARERGRLCASRTAGFGIIQTVRVLVVYCTRTINIEKQTRRRSQNSLII